MCQHLTIILTYPPHFKSFFLHVAHKPYHAILSCIFVVGIILSRHPLRRAFVLYVPLTCHDLYKRSFLLTLTLNARKEERCEGRRGGQQQR